MGLSKTTWSLMLRDVTQYWWWGLFPIIRKNKKWQKCWNKTVSYCICYLQWQHSFPFIDWLVPCLHQSAPSLFLKSNFEYLRGNYRKAVKLLNSSNIAEHPGPIKTGDKCFTSSSHNSKRAVQARLVWAAPVQIVNVLTNASTFGRQWRCRKRDTCFISFRWMCSMYVLEQPGLHSLCNGEA